MSAAVRIPETTARRNAADHGRERTTMTLRASIALALVWTVAAGCGPVVETCGEGTTARDGICVPDAVEERRCGEGTVFNPDDAACEPLVSCGAGTVAMENRCEPIAECGVGTFLDLSTNTCRPESECGAGTYYDEASRLCLPLRSCGAGTTFNPMTDNCEPDFPCASGATLNPDTGLCESFIACGPGQVLVDGLCVSPNQGAALGENAAESVPDNNDPRYGGVAESVTLDPDGETVWTGTIARPADIGGNGALTQDRDVWRFAGEAGTLLTIEVLSLGLPAPAFTLDGPLGYRRESALGYEADAKRQVILPRDGAYDLTVVPTAFLLSGVPLGAPEAGYAIRITAVSAPGFPNMIPGDSWENPAIIEANLKTLTDNLVGITAPSNTAIQLNVRTLSDDFVAALLVFDNDGNLISDRQGLGEDDFSGVFVPDAGAVVYVDWQSSTGPEDAVEIEMFEIPLTDRGLLTADASNSTQGLDLPGRTAGAYRVEVPEAQVMLADYFGDGLFNPDVMVVGPGGTRAMVEDDDEFFFYADAGVYVFFCFNDGTADDTGVAVALTLQTPYNLGALSPEGPAAGTAVGDDLVFGFDGYERAFLIVEAAVPALLSLEVQAEAGDPDLSIYRIDGTRLRRSRRPTLSRPVQMVNRDPRPLLIELESDAELLIDWSVRAEVRALPPFIDAEPNDVRALAAPINTVPMRGRGFMNDDEIDVYEVVLDAPLAEGSALRIHFDNIESDTSYGFITDGVELRVYDQNFLPLQSIPHPEDGWGTQGTNTATFVAAYEGAGPYYLELDGRFYSDDMEYVLSVDVVEQVVENEPNDTASLADALGALPASVVGYREDTGGDDVYRLTLQTPVVWPDSIEVHIENWENNNKVEVLWVDGTGAVRGMTERTIGSFNVTDVEAGDYDIVVTGTSGGEFVYQLSVLAGGVTEVEPNESELIANDMGAVSDGAPLVWYATTNNVDVDYFTFTLDEPLADGRSVRVKAYNVDDGSDQTLEVFGNASVDLDWRRATDLSVSADTLFAAPGETGPFLIRVGGENNALDRVKLQVELAGPSEIEPNDGENNATPIAQWPTVVTGSVGPGAVDVYALDLSQGDNVRIQMDNISDGSNTTLSIRASDFVTELGSGTGFRVTRTIPALIDATFFVVVSQSGDAALQSDLYTLDVRSE